MSKSIAVLGGAFNPPHQGHKKLSSALHPLFEETWIMPCFAQRTKTMAHADHRLAMCRLLFTDPHEKVSDFEIKNNFSGGTYQTMLCLQRQFPQHDFRIVIGQDNADSVTTWIEWEKLISTFSFVVVPRKGYRLDESSDRWYMDRRHMYYTSFDVPEISSTEIRKAISQGNHTAIPDCVYAYVKKHGLYK